MYKFLSHNRTSINTLQVIAYPAIIILIGIIIYANTFNVQFEFDDKYYIADNPAVKDIQYFFNRHLQELEISREVLDQNFRTRIVTYFTFYLNYIIHGYNIWGYHAANLCIHIINGLLIYSLLLSTFRTPYFTSQKIFEHCKVKNLIAFAAALFFISHPIQTESVTYISQRFTSLATMLYLLSLFSYVKWRSMNIYSSPQEECTNNNKKYYPWPLYILSLTFNLLAVFTKEISFTLPVIIFIYELMFFEKLSTKRLFFIIPFISTMLIIPMIVFSGTSEFQDIERLLSSSTDADKGNAALVYLFTQCRVIITYLRLLILPVNQNLDYDYPQFADFFTPPVIFSFIFICLLILFSIFLYGKSMKNNSYKNKLYRLISFGIIWFFVTLSVESSIIPLRDFIFEHRLYLPSIGFFIALTCTLSLFIINNKKFYKYISIFILLAVIIFSTMTFNRNIIWNDTSLLWGDAARKSPNKARPHNAYANALWKMNPSAESIDLVIREMETAFSLEKEHEPLMIDLGKYYRIKGDLINSNNYDNVSGDKFYWYKKSLDVLSQAADFDKRVVNEEHRKKERNKGTPTELIADVGNIETYYNLGIAFNRLGRYDESLAAYRYMIHLEPLDHKAYQEIASLLHYRHEYRQAAVYLHQLLLLNDTDPEIMNRLLRVYQQLSQGECISGDNQGRQGLDYNCPAAHNLVCEANLLLAESLIGAKEFDTAWDVVQGSNRVFGCEMSSYNHLLPQFTNKK